MITDQTVIDPSIFNNGPVWYRGVIEQYAHGQNHNGPPYKLEHGKPYSKPGPAKAWITRRRKNRPGIVHDAWIEQTAQWRRID